MTHHSFTRRGLLTGVAAVGAVGLSGLSLGIAGPRQAQAAAAPKLPARGNYVIRKAYVMSMEKGIGDIKDGDILVWHLGIWSRQDPLWPHLDRFFKGDAKAKDAMAAAKKDIDEELGKQLPSKP